MSEINEVDIAIAQEKPTVSNPVEAVVSGQLEANTWYWMSVYSEGDVFTPYTA